MFYLLYCTQVWNISINFHKTFNEIGRANFEKLSIFIFLQKTQKEHFWRNKIQYVSFDFDATHVVKNVN